MDIMNMTSESLDELFNYDEEQEMQDEMEDILEEYKEKFGHAIPYYLFPETITEEEIFEKIRKCLQSGEDNIVELLEGKVDKNVLY